MIELDQLLRETDLCVQGLRKYFWQLVPWLVQEQKINTIGLDQSTSINFWERHICEFKVCVYFWQLVPWLVQKLDCVYFFALAPARALAVKNIYANLELTNRSLSNRLNLINRTGTCLVFALAPAKEIAVKNICKPWTHKSVSLASCLFFALAPAKALAVKNIRKPWTHKWISLSKSIELDWSNSDLS